MARTCIICGLKAGSREHLFPAGLGGRRTNKGIYCGKHNNDYAGLAGVLATQLNIVNAHIGVQGDHASAPTHREIVDAGSGRPYRFWRTKSEWSAPRHSLSGDGREIVVEARSRAEALDHARSLGLTPDKVEFKSETRRQVFLSPVHEELEFGGPEGLRAVAYVAQTFFAHHFPELARTAMMDGVKTYTLEGGDNAYVWWEFEPSPDLADNPFPFGHRVVVGMDGGRPMPASSSFRRSGSPCGWAWGTTAWRTAASSRTSTRWPSIRRRTSSKPWPRLPSGESSVRRT
jgi:hypothetical protein